MGAYPIPRLFTLREYLRIERAAQTKSEYVDGQIFAMAGGANEHEMIGVNLLVLLQNQFKGGQCRARSADFRIAVSKTGPLFYPDVSVICGEPEFLDSSRDCAMNPVAIFEVLSRSTQKYDRETKTGYYRQMPSLRHIVLISQFAVDVEHHFLAADNAWQVEHLTGPATRLELRAVPASLVLSDIYERVRL